MSVPPYYKEAYIAYAIRLLAWKKFIARDQNAITDDDIEDIILQVFSEFGGIDMSGPTIYNYTKDVREKLTADHKPKNWNGDEWYLLYAPFHQVVRNLSLHPVVQGPYYNAYEMTLRDPAVPTLKVTVGNGVPDSQIFEDNPRVIYILRHEENDDEQMYIGMTDRDGSRMKEHTTKKDPHWWFIAQPLDNYNFDDSVQESTETMLTAFWNEIAHVSMSNQLHRIVSRLLC